MGATRCKFTRNCWSHSGQKRTRAPRKYCTCKNRQNRTLKGKKRQNLTLKRLTEEDTKMIIIFECIEKNLLLITRILYYWFPNLTSKDFFLSEKLAFFHSNLPFFERP